MASSPSSQTKVGSTFSRYGFEVCIRHEPTKDISDISDEDSRGARSLEIAEEAQVSPGQSGIPCLSRRITCAICQLYCYVIYLALPSKLQYVHGAGCEKVGDMGGKTSSYPSIQSCFCQDHNGRYCVPKQCSKPAWVWGRPREREDPHAPGTSVATANSICKMGRYNMCCNRKVIIRGELSGAGRARDPEGAAGYASSSAE